jgi:hypothetical protein
MRMTLFVFRRELEAYFLTPIATVFLVAFLSLTAAVTFYLGDFLARGRADLQTFFSFHPWLYLAFIPALGMRLWAEDWKRRATDMLFIGLGRDDSYHGPYEVPSTTGFRDFCSDQIKRYHLEHAV